MNAPRIGAMSALIVTLVCGFAPAQADPMQPENAAPQSVKPLATPTLPSTPTEQPRQFTPPQVTNSDAKGAKETVLPSAGITVSEFYKQDVYDPRDNKIGEVKDAVLDKGGQLNTVILAVGGLLGIGEKDVAVPFNAISVKDKDGKRYLIMDTTKEALEGAPGYVYDRDSGQWVPAS
jgi:sporulation protein YlmC with PRC-barrel domain